MCERKGLPSVAPIGAKEGHSYPFQLPFMSPSQAAAIAADSTYTLELGDKKLIIRSGMLGNQANATVLCQMGETVCMSNCTISAKARDGVDFLPLQLVYQEKYYAGGKIAGSRFRKREGRPRDQYVLL